MMKNKISIQIVVLFFLLLFSGNIYSQIVYEHTYPFVNAPGGYWVGLSDIGNGDFKFIYFDYSTNELKIFNIDHSLFISIQVQVQLLNVQEYVIGYVTKSLFDCDTNMIEFAVMPVNWRRTFYIYRQDGTMLFSQDSTKAPWCSGCFGGSNDVRPIVSTPSGSKMFLAKCDSNGLAYNVDVFSICGTLPLRAVPIVENTSIVSVYPNPSHRSQIFFEFHNNFSSSKSELIIYDENGRTINSFEVNEKSGNIIFDGSLHSSGIYYYRLITRNNTLQTGKFIIN